MWGAWQMLRCRHLIAVVSLELLCAYVLAGPNGEGWHGIATWLQCDLDLHNCAECCEHDCVRHYIALAEEQGSTAEFLSCHLLCSNLCSAQLTGGHPNPQPIRVSRLTPCGQEVLRRCPLCMGLMRLSTLAAFRWNGRCRMRCQWCGIGGLNWKPTSAMEPFQQEMSQTPSARRCTASWMG